MRYGDRLQWNLEPVRAEVCPSSTTSLGFCPINRLKFQQAPENQVSRMTCQEMNTHQREWIRFSWCIETSETKENGIGWSYSQVLEHARIKMMVDQASFSYGCKKQKYWLQCASACLAKTYSPKWLWLTLNEAENQNFPGIYSNLGNTGMLEWICPVRPVYPSPSYVPRALPSSRPRKMHPEATPAWPVWRALRCGPRMTRGTTALQQGPLLHWEDGILALRGQEAAHNLQR